MIFLPAGVEQHLCHLEKSWTCQKKGKIHSWNFPFLVHRPRYASLFDALKPGTTPRRSRWLRVRIFRRRFRVRSRHIVLIGQGRLTIHFKGHPSTVFPGVNRRHPRYRHRQIARHATKTGLEFNEVVTDLQLVGRTRAEIEDDLPITYEFTRHPGAFIDINRDMRREAAVTAPLPESAKQVRLGRGQRHVLLAHRLFGWRQRVDKPLAAENTLSIFHQRRSGLAKINTVVIETPEQRRNGHVEHGKLVTQHELLLVEDRHDLGQTSTNFLARLVGCLTIFFDHFHERKNFAFHADQQLTGASTHDRNSRHQLRMRKALIDVLVNDVRFKQDQIALDQNRNTIVRIDRRHFLRLVEHVDIDNLKIHALFEQDNTAAMTKGAGRTRIEVHHVW